MTIFIGGNHEASNYLQSLYYGGYVAPNIYFLGYAGVVWYGGLRIAGISGIYKDSHFSLGHYERFPYSHDDIRSVYHMRELEVYRLAHCTNPIDIFLSHDWPQDIWEYGNKQSLLAKKPFLREDIAAGKLGAPPLMNLLQTLQPKYWFAAHFHVKFPAIVPHAAESVADPALDELVLMSPVPMCREVEKSHDSHQGGEANSKSTRFIALDKVLPGRYNSVTSFLLLLPFFIDDIMILGIGCRF
jgi:lariat debranching enzyme